MFFYFGVKCNFAPTLTYEENCIIFIINLISGEMKNKLLAAMALCCATSMSVWAGDWGTPELAFTEPDLTIPTDPIPTNGFTYHRNLGDYYIYHVATGKFLSNSGTQLAVGSTGQLIRLAYGYDRVLYNADTYTATGWLITMPNAKSQSPDGGIYHEIFITSQTQCWTDANGGHMLWKIVPQGDGTYAISVIDEDETYGSASEYVNSFMARVTDTDAETNLIFPVATPATMTNIEKDWKFVTPAVYEAFQAKANLVSMLNLAEEKGFTELDEYLAVYNSTTATKEDVEQAAVDLARAITKHVAAGASTTNPVDVTFNLPGADCNSKADWNIVSEPVKVLDNGESWAKVGDNNWPNGQDSFMEPCDWGKTGWSGEFNKTIAVPNGMYKLTAYGRRSLNSTMVIYANEVESENFQEANRGGTIDIYGNEWPSYADGVANGAEFACNGEGYGWESRSITVTVRNGELTVGCKASSTGQHEWCSIDHFRLYYLGEEDLEYIINELRSSIETAKTTKTDYDENNMQYSAAGVQAFDDAVAEAEALINNTAATEAEFRAMLTKLRTTMEAFAYDVKVYNELLPAQLERIETLVAGIENGDEILAGLVEYYGVIDGAYNELTFDPTTYNDVVAEIDRLYKEDVFKAIQAGLLSDITPMIVNADFSNGKTGWSGDPTVNNGAGERFDKTFDVYQVIENLPMGTYEISVQGFYRPAGHGIGDVATNWDPTGDNTFNTVNAYLYGNSAKAPLLHIFANSYAEKPSTGGWSEVTCPQDETIDGKFVPNDMASASFAFSDGQYTGCTVKCAVGEDGKLRFGVKMESKLHDNNWTMFDNFKITYLGEDLDGFKVELNSVLASAQTLIDSEDIKATTDAGELSSLKVSIEMAMDTYNTKEQYSSAISQLNEKMELVKNGIALIKTVYAKAQIYNDAINNGDYDSYDAGMVNNLFDSVDNILYLYDENQFETLASVEEMEQAMFEAYNAMIMFGVKGSAENPADVTALIQCPSFTDMTGAASTEGWDLDGGKGVLKEQGTGNGNGDNLVEVYEKSSFDVNQTLDYLTPGWYILKMQGYYRSGYNDVACAARKEGTETINAYLYAAPSDQEVSEAPLCSMFEGMITGFEGTPGRVASDVLVKDEYKLEGDGEYCYVPMQVNGADARFKAGYYMNEITFQVTADTKSVRIGVKKDELAVGGDWTIFDNFQLFFTGDEKPVVAIEGVETSTASVVSAEYYTINGVRIAKPAKSGLYIRKALLSDGTTKVTKIMVK